MLDFFLRPNRERSACAPTASAEAKALAVQRWSWEGLYVILLGVSLVARSVICGGLLAVFLGCSTRPLARQRLWLFRPDLPEVPGCSFMLQWFQPEVEEVFQRKFHGPSE